MKKNIRGGIAQSKQQNNNNNNKGKAKEKEAKKKEKQEQAEEIKKRKNAKSVNGKRKNVRHVMMALKTSLPGTVEQEM